MNRYWKSALSAAILALLAACGGDDDDPAGTPTGATPTAYARQFTTDFTRDTDGWTPESSDYTTATAPSGMVVEQRVTDQLGLGYPAGSKALYVSARNNSSDTFVYLKKQLTGFTANTSYTVTFTVNLLTIAPTGCLGAGATPGESVWAVAGAAPAEPKAVTEGSNVKFSLDKGNNGTAGATSVVLGDIGNGRGCSLPQQYTPKLYRNVAGPTVKSDAEGKIWVYLGIDSAYNDLSSVYLQSVTTSFVPVTTS
ncbi:hypothetical protein [Massilia sp. YMA4]|uniref:hypothetical protein n=1 Tax=Massilia sp. YMA4 TaxID=1593482 RepID=UPI000DD122DA|nr:hypothetical protein [Massilia sp. YMA4]AXA89807.1 hypothetical protein DPH57_00620 [Massilia sp. YMA4]